MLYSLKETFYRAEMNDFPSLPNTEARFPHELRCMKMGRHAQQEQPSLLG